MAFQLGKMTRRTGSHSKKHIYYNYTRMQESNNKTRIQSTKAKHACSCFMKNAGRDKDTSKAKTLQPSIALCIQSLIQFYLPGTRHHNIHSNKQGKDHPQRQGGQTGPLGSLWRGTWRTERVPRYKGLRVQSDSLVYEGGLFFVLLCESCGAVSPASKTV